MTVKAIRLTRTTLFFSISLSMAVLPAPAAAAATNAEKINAIADRYYAFRLQTQPETAYFSGVKIDQHDGLYDNSPEALEAEQAMEDHFLAELASIDPASVQGSVEWITFGFLDQALHSARELRVCRNELWAVSQMSGWQLDYTRLAQRQPVGTAELRVQALARWSKLPRFIDQEIINLKRGLILGYSSPKAAVRRVISQLNGLLAVPPEESPFASPARRDEDEAFNHQFMLLVKDGIVPAVARYRDYLAHTYQDQAREALAVTVNPDGRACYEASLKSYTTLDRSPEAVYDLGKKTVAANRKRVEELGKVAYGLTDFTAIMDKIKADSNDRFGSRQELLEFSRETVSAARIAMPEWFGHVAKRDATVEPYPDYQDGTGVSSRYEPGDESRPGVFRITLFEPGKQSRGGSEAVAFHEVWPGHHLQVSLAQEIKGLHPITQITWYSGMGEGWARYAETLAAEMGLYKTVIGPISRLAWPARGMVVDPGIHVKGWTREQAIEFMGRAGRMTDTELDDMVDRISVLPGQLTAYDSGGLEIFALRKLAREQLGDAFDIRVFHDRVLENGTVPLEMLRRHVEGWVEAGVARQAH